jgi:hypothetical protein
MTGATRKEEEEEFFRSLRGRRGELDQEYDHDQQQEGLTPGAYTVRYLFIS